MNRVTELEMALDKVSAQLNALALSHNQLARLAQCPESIKQAAHREVFHCLAVSKEGRETCQH